MGGKPDASGPLSGPVIKRVQYNDGVLSVSWHADRNTATTFRVHVFDGTRLVAEAETGSAAHVSMAVELGDGGSHEVTVCEVDAGAPRQWSARIPVVTDSVAIDRAETDPVSGAPTLRWAAAEDDEYLVRIEVNGAPAGPDSPAVGGSFTLAQPLPPGSTVTAAPARVRHHHGTVSIGPYGPRFVVWAQRPELIAVGFEAGVLSAEWTGVPGADGYRVSVLRDGQVCFQDITPASTTSFETEPGITGRLAHAVVVQALSAVGSGAPSAPLPVLPIAPELTAVRSDGSTVSVDVTPPPGPAPTAYLVALLRDGLPVRSATLGVTATLSLTVPETVTPGVAYSVSVRARSGRSTGPAATAPALLAAPVVSSIVCRMDLTITAEAGKLPANALMEARLQVDGVPGSPRRLDADRTAVFSAPAGAVTVEVRGLDGIATGPWSEPVPALTERVAFTAARVEENRVSLAWEGRSGATFRAAVGAAGVVTGGQTADLPLSGGTASIAEVAGVATGPVTTLALPANAVRITYGSVDAGRRVTLQWTGGSPPAMTGLQPVVRWADNVLELDVARVTYPLVVTLPEEVPNAATVALRAISPLSTGPLGNAVSLLTLAPTGLDVTYDGAVVTAAWDPAPAPSVDRYAVVLSRPGAADVVVTTREPRAHIDLRLESATTTAPTITVAAMAGGISRGLPTAPVPLFAETLFPGRSFIAPQWGPVFTPTDITLGLPELFTIPQTGTIPLPLGLTLSPGGSTPYAYTLLIPAASPVWNFTDRTDVLAEWRALLSQLEDLGITSYGVAALGEAVSRSMPQTFAETLYFAYGLRFDDGCFDLRPGVVLRVEYENYQVSPGAESNLLSGYVATAVADYEVASCDRYGRWAAGPDAFLNALTQQGVVVLPPESPQDPSQAYGGGGVIDLFAPTMQLPFTRVVYPPEVLQTTSPGSAYPQQNVLFLAGPRLSALDTATDNVRLRDAPGPSVAATYLRGRAVVRPMIRISVDGAPRLVPLGTTLGNVLAGEGRRPPDFALPLRGVTLRRARAAAVPAGGPVGDWPVAVDWSGVDLTVLDLPLLHGDRLSLPGGDGP